MLDKSVIIVGAGKENSIGQTARRRLAYIGWGTCAMDLEPLKGDIAIDVRSVYSVERAFERVDGFQHLVYSVGINIPMNIFNFDSLGIKNFDEILQVNLRGAYLCISNFLKIRDVNRKSTIVIIGSNSCQVPRTKAFAYTASKSGLGGMVLSLARDLAPHNISIVQLDFGMIKDTPLTFNMESILNKSWKQMRYRQKLPADMTIENAAEWICFILEHGKFATGSCLRIDGAEA